MSETQPPAPIQIGHEAGLTIVRVRPALVSSDWSTTERAADQVIRELEPSSPPRCVVDLTELDYLGSSQVAFIVRVWKSVRAAEGEFAVACPQPVVVEVLRLAGLDKLLAILPTREAAVRSLAPPRGMLGRGGQRALSGLAAAGAITSVASWGLLFADRVPAHVGRPAVYVGTAIGVVAGGAVGVLGGGRARVCGAAAAVVAAATLLATLWQ